MLHKASWIFFSFLILALAHPSTASSQLAFSMASDSLDHVISAVILKIAYAEIGIPVLFKNSRNEKNFGFEGQEYLDGKVLGGDNIAPQHTNLIRIAPPTHYVASKVYTLRPWKIQSWQSLAPYTVGIVQGMPLISQKTLGMRTIPAKTPARALEYLRSGQIDLLVAFSLDILVEMRLKKHSDIIEIHSPLQIFPVFHYLNPRHAELEQKISQVLGGYQAEQILKFLGKNVRKIILARARLGHEISCPNLDCYFNNPGQYTIANLAKQEDAYD